MAGSPKLLREELRVVVVAKGYMAFDPDWWYIFFLRVRRLPLAVMNK